MKYVTFALFTDSDLAGKAISTLKQKDYTKEISVIAKKESKDEISSTQVKENLNDGTVAGGVLGALAGVVGLVFSPVVLPSGIVLLVGGPLTALLGATTGALTGGLVGALVDASIPSKKAEIYEDRILSGDILVAVTSEKDTEKKIESIFSAHKAVEILTVPERL